MNVLSLFDGISCGHVALNRAGIHVDRYFASEVDKNCIAITQWHYPETVQVGDVSNLAPGKLPKIDILMGGSPCQGFSMAGKRLNLADERSALFFEFVRLLRALKPKYFLLENVKMKQQWQDIISEHLGVYPIRINSSRVSAAKRDRLYWTNIPDVMQPHDSGKTFDDINDYSQDWMAVKRVEMIRAWKAQQKPLKNATVIGAGSKLPCLTARGYNQYHSGMILITDELTYRYLSNLEAERAQTSPSQLQ